MQNNLVKEIFPENQYVNWGFFSLILHVNIAVKQKGV